jgi:hypothetical protein
MASASSTSSTTAQSNAWSGWVGFAALLVLVIAAIDVLTGLIAMIRGSYYVIHGSQLIVFDTTAWGAITLIIGLGVAGVGFGLAGGAGWARWIALIVVSLNLLEHLLWLGNAGFTLWGLTLITMQILVIYALTARWNEAAHTID